MQFFDGSAELDRQLAKSKVDVKRPVVYVGVKREDGSGMEAGNLGLDRFEIAIGFSEGGSLPRPSHSSRVERTLAERWNVLAIPPDKGRAAGMSGGQAAIGRAMKEPMSDDGGAA